MSTLATNRFFILLFALVVCLAGSGCTSTATSSVSGQDSIRTLTTSGNTHWELVKWTSIDDGKQEIPSPAPTLRIGYKGRISGHAFVNDYVGNVTVSDDVLNWGPHIAATRETGSPELMDAENHYLKSLKSTTHVTIRNDQLIFTGPKPLRLTFKRANP